MRWSFAAILTTLAASYLLGLNKQQIFHFAVKPDSLLHGYIPEASISGFDVGDTGISTLNKWPDFYNLSRRVLNLER